MYSVCRSFFSCLDVLSCGTRTDVDDIEFEWTPPFDNVAPIIFTQLPCRLRSAFPPGLRSPSRSHLPRLLTALSSSPVHSLVLSSHLLTPSLRLAGRCRCAYPPSQTTPSPLPSGGGAPASPTPRVRSGCGSPSHPSGPTRHYSSRRSPGRGHARCMIMC